MVYFAFVFGVVFGSFINVVIYRLNPALKLKGGVFGRSFCPECKTQLKWYDLAPIISFFLLKGRCRYCHKKISWQYPMVEVFSGLLWVLMFNKNFDNFQFFSLCEIWQSQTILNFQSIFNFQVLNPLNLLNFFYFIFIFSALLVIAVYDFKWKVIPDKIVYPAIVAALIFNFVKYLNLETFKLLNFETLKLLNLETLKLLNLETLKLLNFETFITSFLTACAAFLFFFSIFYFSNGRAMGLGDAKLAFLIGLFLSPTEALTALSLAFIIGAIFGIMLMAISKIPHPLVYKGWGMKSQIAFGPFLVIGAVMVFFFSGFIFKLLNFLNF